MLIGMSIQSTRHWRSCIGDSGTIGAVARARAALRGSRRRTYDRRRRRFFNRQLPHAAAALIEKGRRVYVSVLVHSSATGTTRMHVGACAAADGLTRKTQSRRGRRLATTTAATEAVGGPIRFSCIAAVSVLRRRKCRKLRDERSRGGHTSIAAPRAEATTRGEELGGQRQRPSRGARRRRFRPAPPQWGADRGWRQQSGGMTKLAYSGGGAIHVPSC